MDTAIRSQSDRLVRAVSTGRKAMKKRRLFAGGVFLALVARIFMERHQHNAMLTSLLATYDLDHNDRLTATDMAKLFQANGIDLKESQVKTLFGSVDDEGNGFEKDELEKVVAMMARIPAVSNKIKSVASTGRSVRWDVAICLAAGLALLYLLENAADLEKKWAANSWRNARTFKTMEQERQKLEAALQKISDERSKVEETILEKKASGLLEDSEEMLRLREELREKEAQQERTVQQLTREVSRWRREAEQCMADADNAREKMSAIASCIQSIDSFSGAGKKEFKESGAITGFQSGTKTFGTMLDRQVMMYEVVRPLGDGRNGASVARDMATHTEYAVKQYGIRNPRDRRSIYNDLFALQEASANAHPNILRYHRVIETEREIWVIMDLLKGKDLFEYCLEDAFSEPKARPLFRELTSALGYLHEKDIIHCDVKPENAVIVGGNPHTTDTAKLILIDFGCSCFRNHESERNRALDCFDNYVPPEHARSATAPTVYTDLWRLGCTLYIMLCKLPPFTSEAPNSMRGYRMRMEGAYYKAGKYGKLSEEAKKLLASLINGTPKNRPTCNKLLKEDPWVTAGS